MVHKMAASHHTFGGKHDVAEEARVHKMAASTKTGTRRESP